MNFVIKAYSELLEVVDFEHPIDILEFGCGTGYTNKWLCQRFNVKKLSLIDLNTRMLNVAKGTLSEVQCEKEFINMDFFSVETDEKYDIVHSQGVIEHFETEKRIELLKKHCDSTKPQGYCIIYFPTPSNPYRFFKKAAEILGVWKFTDEVPLRSTVVVDEMKSFGFTPVKSNLFWRSFLTEEGVIFKRTV
ncbi:MAG: class I SAM-dependent methyltransferase [Spirochaetales bacterium]|nr:class I SAM-dependent methyltransferase [Spirochaetales bacterium]